MAARPKRIPQWATDAAYVAIGKAWNAMAPTVEPPSGLKAEGWEPGVAPNARFLNWLFNMLGGWTAHLANVQLLNWTRRDVATPIPTLISAIAYDPSSVLGNHGETVLVVGGSGNAAASLDGETWYDVSGAISTVLYAVRYIDGSGVDKWVAVGQASIWTSPRDLSAWTSRTPATGGTAWRALAHGPGATAPLVIVGENGAINSSTDGITWTARTSGTVEDLNCIEFADGLYVVTGENGVVLTSANGQTWTARTIAAISAGNSLGGLAYDPRVETWVILDVDDSRISTSPDGITWTHVATLTLPYQPRRLSSDGQGTLVVVDDVPASGALPRGQKLHVSTDGGVTWTVVGYASRSGIGVSDLVAAGGYGALTYCGTLGWMLGGSDGSDAFLYQSVRL